MNIPSAAGGRSDFHGHLIEVADTTLNFKSLVIADNTPTGAQLAAAAGFTPAQQAVVLQILANGELEDIRPDEQADLRHGEGRFVIVESDRTFHFTVDGRRFDWPAHIVSGALVRKLANVPDDKTLYLERTSEPDRLVGPHDLIDLAALGVESFMTRAVVWKLNVQGVILELTVPTIRVKDALSQAGFDPTQEWIIFLKVAGAQKREVSLTDQVDLRTPGIEKLRLTPKHVNNGEALPAPRRMFALLEVDQRHLDARGLFWETIIDAGRRWLLIHHYPVPNGYTVTHTLLALEIPSTYPSAQIDMFYVNPALVLRSGRTIERSDTNATIAGTTFKRWSRHRGSGSKWNPNTDNVVTHLALVESAMLKEVET